jgi:hypothetical protein
MMDRNPSLLVSPRTIHRGTSLRAESFNETMIGVRLNLRSGRVDDVGHLLWSQFH